MKKNFLYFLFFLIISSSGFFILRRKEEFIKNPARYLPAEKLNRVIVETRMKIDENPEDIFSYIEGGVALYQKGRDYYPEAVNLMQKALKLGAADIKIFFYLAVMYDELNLSEKAFSSYEKFLRNRPQDFYMRLRYGNLFFRLNRYQFASEQYGAALSVEPKNQTALINLALSYKARDMYDEALEKFKLAQTINPVIPPEILIKIAETYLIKKDFISAETYYKKVIEKKPNSAPALFGLGETYMNMNKKPEAKKCFQKVLEIEPNNLEAKKYIYQLNK
ncbi:MAG: tetratricopeptide repeat protein [Elusimicrobiota bacterium]|nr:tetratricopeptide repeat protein [Elusimicrobiota bacterium]